MVVPLILGKMAKDIMDGDLTAESTPVLALSVGFVAALITGVIACTWMISLVRKAQLSWFAIYCMIVGAGAILYQL
jgi:undecaprenyl-diphosphatase